MTPMTRRLATALRVLTADPPQPGLCPASRWYHSGPCHPADR